MKRTFFLIASLFLLAACSTEDAFPCIQCDRQTAESDLSHASPNEFLCKYCAKAAKDLQSCASCGNVFAPNSDTTRFYCTDCVGEYAATCCSCGELTDKFTLVSKEADDGLFYYFCAPCAEDILARFEINYDQFTESADPQP